MTATKKKACFRFRPGPVQDIIHEVMYEVLEEAEYNTEEVPHWSQTIANEIKRRLKGTTKHIFVK